MKYPTPLITVIWFVMFAIAVGIIIAKVVLELITR